MRSFIFFLFFLFFNVADAQQLHITKTSVVGNKDGIEVDLMMPTTDNGILWWGVTVDSTGGGDIPACLPRTHKKKGVAGKLDSNGNSEWVRVYCNNTPDAGAGCPSGEGYVVPGVNIDTSDIYINKIDCQGNIIWHRRWASSRPEGARKAIRTNDGGYMVLAESSGNDGDIPFNYSPGSLFAYDDIILIKTDNIGQTEWIKVYGSSTNDWSRCIFQIDDYYYILASTDGLSHDHDFADTAAYPGASFNYLMKINNTGDLIWSRTIGSANAFDAIFDSNDSTFVITGSCSLNYPPYYCNDGYIPDYGIAKIDMEGNILWAKHYGEMGIYEHSSGISQGPGNTYIVVGYIEGITNPQPPHIGNREGLIYWLDVSGNVIDRKFYGNPTISTYIPSVIPLQSKFVIANDDVYSSYPYTEGTWNFNPGVGVGEAFSVCEAWTSSITVNNTLKTLKVYPNPAKDFAYFEYNMPQKINNVFEIVSMDGKKIYQTDLTQDKGVVKWDVHSIIPGTYLYKIRSGKSEVCSGKVVVAK